MALSASAPWRNYYGNTPATLDYPHLTMYQLLRRNAQQHGDNIAYTFMGKETSYKAFLARIEAAAKGLTAMGITRGDRVTICMPNSPQALDCFYALNRIGAIPNMIHPLSAEREIAFYLEESKSKAILTLDQFYDKVAAVAGKTCTILIARIKDELPVPLNLLYPMTKGARAIQKLPATGYVLWKDMIEKGKKTRLYTYCNVKEDAFDIYGFHDMSEKRCFEMLIGVSGVGPKAALSILSANTPEAFAMAVITGNEKALTAAPGIGKKLAQRIILELKDKISKEAPEMNFSTVDGGTMTAVSGKMTEAAAALAVLGYGQNDIAVALKGIDAENLPLEEIVRQSLKKMVKG